MKIHFIGIGGVSMSALAKILAAEGHCVCGSDLRQVSLDGIVTYRGHSVHNLRCPDLVVYTAAVHGDNPELCEAKRQGIPVVERSDLLGRISRRYKECIAVSGAHGKTTTSAMLAAICMKKDPTVHLGGDLALIGGNCRIGGGELFVTEACEYVRSFVALSPTVGVILNISPDHLDYYRDIDDIANAFGEFAGTIREGGTLVIDGSCAYYNEIVAATRARVVRFGSCQDYDYSADEIMLNKQGYASFNLLEKGTRGRRIELSVRGSHNVGNSLAAIAAARTVGLGMDEIEHGLKSFVGVARRFEDRGRLNSASVILDYAHHPEEITASIGLAQSIFDRVAVVFQPHTYSRTKSLLKEFALALLPAHTVLLAEVYAAREAPLEGGTSSALEGELCKLGRATRTLSFEGLAEEAVRLSHSVDAILVLGAGDIDGLLPLLGL